MCLRSLRAISRCSLDAKFSYALVGIENSIIERNERVGIDVEETGLNQMAPNLNMYNCTVNTP